MKRIEPRRVEIHRLGKPLAIAWMKMMSEMQEKNLPGKTHGTVEKERE